MNHQLPYSQALSDLEPDPILDLLTDDVEIRVAVHDDPLRGKQTAAFLFGILQQELGQITITDELIDGDRAAVMFDTSINGITAHGLNIIHHTPNDTIDELTVFFRPLDALADIAKTIGAHMEAEFGPRASET